MDFSFPIALKPPTKFPLFSPPPPSPSPPHLHRPSEIRFSRWNNANADKFNRQERTQKDLEDQIRIQKRFDSALTIAHNYNPAPPHLTTKSTGTPSSPSSPSVPGKFSKYSKPPHPAFKTLITKSPKIDPNPNPNPNPETPNFKIDENGVSYELPEAPFLYRYSYTETPKVRPVKLREPLVSPFGPESMPKPWLGRKPLPPSKKRLPEFDSFRLPPPHKKGVKSVQSPGPYLPGSGPKYVKSREEVLGEPLTKEEVLELVNSCKKSDRQLNMGRDGLTHNMLDNIHAHWKRRRVCKIKCKGVCTVDMENVSQQLEERTGGKIIYSRGGVVYLFRGRNYNYKYRPRFPLMLWKPVSPVYPRLIKKIPEGLTIEEAIEMRKKGRDLTPICKLAKNGVYSNLVKDIKEAFEACELVRINCQGLNPSDYRKIGAKLKDLVPCVLISFEYEHILIWRGRDWRSSFTEDKESPKGLEEEVQEDNVASGQLGSPSSVLPLSITHSNSDIDTSSSLTHGSGEIEGIGDSAEVGVTELVSGVIDFSGVDSHETLNKESIGESTSFPLHAGGSGSHSEEFDGSPKSETVSDGTAKPELSLGKTDPDGSILTSSSAIPQPHNQLSNVIKSEELMKLSSTSGVLLLREQAVDSGLAFVLDDDSLDADIVFKKAASFGKTAPTGPVFRHRPRKSAVQEMKEHERDDSQVKKAPAVVGTEMAVSGKRVERKTSRTSKKMKDSKVDYLNVVPQGKLAIDELAKLLA